MGGRQREVDRESARERDGVGGGRDVLYIYIYIYRTPTNSGIVATQLGPIFKT